MEYLYDIDKAIFLFFNAQLSHPILDVCLTRITHFGFWTVPFLLCAALFIMREKKKALTVLAVTLLCVGLSDLLSNWVIKKIVARPRPCNPNALIEGGRYLLGYYKSYSFPSSHSMNMFSAATVLFCFYRKQGIYFFSFALIIAYSRVYCGVHFPADVFAGAVFGVGLGYGVYAGYTKIAEHYGRNPTLIKKN